jgi:TRAP-type transport system periplasmic protein
MIRSRKTWLIGLVVAAAAGMLGALASTASAADITLKFAYVTGPTHPYGVTMTQFKRLVETNSNGRIAVNLTPLYPGGDIPLLNDIKGGSQDGGAVSTAVFAQTGATTGQTRIKNFVALQMPFLIDSYQLESRVISNSSGIAKRMLNLNSAGLQGLALFEGQMRQLVSKGAPIRTLADLRGKKMRTVQSDILNDNAVALGISPTPLAVGDVTQALANGTVTGVEANSALVLTNRWAQAPSSANHITLLNWFPFPAAVVMNQAKWNSLSPSDQAVVTNAAKDLPSFSVNLNESPAFTQTTQATLCAAPNNVRYYRLPQSERKKFIAASQKVYKKWLKDRQVAPYIRAIQAIKARGHFARGVTDSPPASCMEQ